MLLDSSGLRGTDALRHQAGVRGQAGGDSGLGRFALERGTGMERQRSTRETIASDVARWTSVALRGGQAVDDRHHEDRSRNNRQRRQERGREQDSDRDDRRNDEQPDEECPCDRREALARRGRCHAHTVGHEPSTTSPARRWAQSVVATGCQSGLRRVVRECVSRGPPCRTRSPAVPARGARDSSQIRVQYMRIRRFRSLTGASVLSSLPAP